MKSWIVHYQNKYPGGRVHASENSIDVYCSEGNYRVALRKDGNGQWQDVSAEFGASDKHDLAPIPKECRFRKLYADGKIANAEEFEERRPVAEKLAKEECGGKGKVPSEHEIAAWDLQKKREAKQAAASEK